MKTSPKLSATMYEKTHADFCLWFALNISYFITNLKDLSQLLVNKVCYYVTIWNIYLLTFLIGLWPVDEQRVH